MMAVNDQRRAFSDEYENYVLTQSAAYAEIAPEHPLAALHEITTEDLENYPCILVAGKQQEKEEQNFYERTLA